MNQNKVSVLMSVYNEEIRWLSKAVDSILQQTYQNIEFVIVIDNPNNFEIISYLENKQKEDGRIILLKNIKNEGLVSSLNKAFQASSGQYIARMDADDVSDLSRIEYSVQYLLNNDFDLIGSLVSKIDEDGTAIETQSSSGITSRELLKIEKSINIVAHPTWLGKRGVFEFNKGYRHFFAMEDYDFILRSIQNGFRIGIIPKILLQYRVRSNSISQENEYIQFLNSMILRKFYQKNRLDKATPNDFYSKINLPTAKQIGRYNNIVTNSRWYSARGWRKVYKICLTIKDIILYPEAREKVKIKYAVGKYNKLVSNKS